ncbi:ATP-binding protein [Halorubrum ejinorense]|uniref:histidine kinase n=1 Tax=Halorubrum ejinorense TaxID=425309 RepID=A0AAV3SV77_9EURY
MPTLRGRHAVSLLGVGLLAAAALHHLDEVERVRTATGPLLAFALDGGVAVGLIAAGRRIADRGLSPTEEWRVARWTGFGTAFTVAAFSATVGVRVLEGRPLVEPVFPMLVAAGVGGLGGAVAGYYAVRQAADARRARDAVRTVSLVNHLLRHDLRNDLSTIHGYADLLAADDGSDHAAVVASKADEGLERIEAASAVADALLGDADRGRTDLVATVRNVLSGVDGDRSVTVETDLPETAPVAANDGVRAIVHNLVENAAEHGGPDVTVRVAVRLTDDGVALVVADDGPGLPPAARDRLSAPDERRDEAAVGSGEGVLGDSPDGTVSGLDLVAALTEAYDGSLDVGESEHGGARFAVTLPHAPVESAGSDT